MKFFVPELLSRFGSDDATIAEAAQAELEHRAEEYRQALHAIEPVLPHRFRELVEQFYLHDARILSAAGFPVEDAEFLLGSYRGEATGANGHDRGRDPRTPSFGLNLELDAKSRGLLILQYRSVVVEDLIRHETMDEECPYLEWLHDEVELVRSAECKTFRHSILFTKGWELRLTFRDFEFATLRPIEPTEEVTEVGLTAQV